MSVRRRYSFAYRSVAAGKAGTGRAYTPNRTIGDIGDLVPAKQSLIINTPPSGQLKTIIILRNGNSMLDRDLSQVERDALGEALDDEYKSWATYDQVITDFGEIRPFINIRDAEARHIDALKLIFDRYDLAVPANTWLECVPRFNDPLAACQYSVEAEKENTVMYQRLRSSTENSEILATFNRLAEASLQRHLPAFERCVQRYQQGGGNRGNR